MSQSPAEISADEVRMKADKERWAAVYDDAENVDPSCCFNWEGLAIGFFLGAGWSLETARRLIDNEEIKI